MNGLPGKLRGLGTKCSNTRSRVLDRRRGAPRRTRTPSLLVRSQTLYPIELWARAVPCVCKPGFRVAEREGFEPSSKISLTNRLAGGPIRPLSHLSDRRKGPRPRRSSSPPSFRNMAEGVGFEPTELSLNGFQDRRLQPLGHPSGRSRSRSIALGCANGFSSPPHPKFAALGSGDRGS